MHGLCSVPKVCSFGCRNQRKESFTSFGSIVHMCVCMGAGGVGRKGGTLITPLQVCRRVAQATPHTCLVGSLQHYLGKIKNWSWGLHFKTRIFHTQKLDFQFLLEKKPNKSEAVSKLGPTLACQMLSWAEWGHLLGARVGRHCICWAGCACWRGPEGLKSKLKWKLTLPCGGRGPSSQITQGLPMGHRGPVSSTGYLTNLTHSCYLLSLQKRLIPATDNKIYNCKLFTSSIAPTQIRFLPRL